MPRDEAGQRPSALLVSIGLWHMLHIASVAGFEEDVLRLKAAVDTFVQQQSEQVRHNDQVASLKPLETQL